MWSCNIISNFLFKTYTCILCPFFLHRRKHSHNQKRAMQTMRRYFLHMSRTGVPLGSILGPPNRRLHNPYFPSHLNPIALADPRQFSTRFTNLIGNRASRVTDICGVWSSEQWFKQVFQYGMNLMPCHRRCSCSKKNCCSLLHMHTLFSMVYMNVWFVEIHYSIKLEEQIFDIRFLNLVRNTRYFGCCQVKQVSLLG